MKRKTEKPRVHHVYRYDSLVYANAFVIAYQHTMQKANEAERPEDRLALKLSATDYALRLKHMIETFPELMQDTVISAAVRGE